MWFICKKWLHKYFIYAHTQDMEFNQFVYKLPELLLRIENRLIQICFKIFQNNILNIHVIMYT